ncbi:MAG: alpha/beta hydrolase [Desulfovibrio sp.]|nr:alpha/beta hydrolase [Desulfovibrio sp.]
MKWGISLFCGALLVFALSFSGYARELPSRTLPVPEDASPALKQAIETDASAIPWHLEPKDAAAWKDLVQKAAAQTEKKVPGLLRHLEIRCEKSAIAGVPVFLLEPPALPPTHADKILLYFHGGGYVFNPGMAGLPEGIYMAAIGKFKVVAVDYRLAPECPYPAALDDAMAVYKALLESYPAKNIGVFGSSTGGGMTLALCLRAKEEGLPMPGAIAPGTPWSDLSKTGDSYFANTHVDDVLVQYEGLLEGMAKAYAGGHDLKAPLLSPVYGDMQGFPPAILGTGTRDLFLSNTVRTHRKLREAGVPADLLVLEGLSHWQYVQLPPEAPETQFYFSEVAKFFETHLGK